MFSGNGVRKMFRVYKDEELSNWQFRQQRVYVFLGALITPLLTLLLWPFLSGWNVLAMTLITVMFTAEFFILLKSKWLRNRLSEMLLIDCILISVYTLFDAYHRDFDVNFLFGVIVLLFVFGIVLKHVNHVFIFFSVVCTLGLAAIIFSPNPEISKPFLIGYFLIFSIVGYFVIRHKSIMTERLAYRESFLNTIFNQSFEGVMLVDFYSREVFECNTQAVKLFEVNGKDQIIGFPRDKFQVNKLSKEDIVACRKEIMQQGKWESEEEFVTGKGNRKWFHVVIAPLEMRDKKVYLVRFSDITDKKQATRKVLESERRYKKLFERNLAGVFRIDKEGKIVECNKALAVILGYQDAAEIQNQNAQSFFYYDSERKNFLDELRINKVINNYQTILKRKDGSKVYVLQNAHYVDEDNLGFTEGTMVDVSDLRRVTSELEMREQEVGFIMETIDVVVYRLEEKGDQRKLSYISKQAKDILGYSQEEYNSGNVDFRSYYHPNDLPGVQESLKAAKKDGEKKQLVYRFRHYETKAYHWLEETIFPEFDKFGKYKGYIGIARDISSRMQQEHRLRESEQRFRKIFEEGPIGMVIVGVDGEYLMVNSTMCKLLEYSEEELCYPSKIDPTHPEDKARDKELTQQVFDGKRPFYQIEKRYLSKTGETIWTRMTGTVIRDDQGEPIYGLGMIQDITANKKAEIELKASEIKYRTLIENAAEAIVIYDAKNARFIDVNQQTVDLFGYSREELLRLGPLDMSPEVQENGRPSVEVGPTYTRKALTGEFVTFEWTHQAKNGKLISCEVRMMKYPVGNYLLRGSILDITERKRAEKALIASETKNRVLLESIPEAILVVGNDGLITRIKEDTNYFFLLNPDLKRVEDLPLQQDEIDDLLKYVSLTTRHGETYSLDFEASDGTETCYYDSRISRLNNDEAIWAIRDITNRKITEIELAKSTQQYQSLVENTPDGIIIMENQNIIYANPLALRMFGVETMEEIYGREPYEFLSSESAKESKKRLQAAYEGKRFGFKESTIVRPDGSELIVEGVPILMEVGKRRLLQIVLHDLTDRKKLEKEQLRARLAEEANVQLQQEIEERARVERELIQAQRFTKSIIASSIDMIVAADRKGKITEFNQAAVNRFGYQKEDIIGQDVSILYARQDERGGVIRKLIEGEGYFSGEVLNKTKDGEEFVSYLSASSLKNQNGKVVGMMGISRDITELKQAEIELKESEERYRDLFENATDMIQSVDVKGEIMYVNKSWLNQLGYHDHKQVIGKNIFEFIHSESYEHCMEMFTAIFKGEEFERVEMIFRTHDGEKLYAEGNVNCKYENGEPVATRGIFRDITKEREILGEIKESKESYQALFDQAFIGIAKLSLSGRFVQVNTHLCEILGYEEEELQQLNFYDITPESELSKGFDLTAEFLSEDVNRKNIERKFINQKGKQVFANVTVATVKDEENHPQFFVLVFDDITDRKEKERSIQQALLEKETLLQEVHHRVKNNLQVISSILNLQSSYVKDERIIDILKESQNRIKSMSFIHESLYQTKDFSRIHFSDYIRNLANNLIYSYQLTSTSVQLNMDVQDIYLNLDDSIPCGLIVNELVSNALKYAFPDGREGVITIELSEQDNVIRLLIADDGIGLPDGFVIEETDTLGLQLVLTLVEQLSGEMDVKVSKGTRFLINFNRDSES